MNRLSLPDRARILGCLTEGNSMRATSRMCDVSINTVTKLLVDVGTACDLYLNETLRNLPCKRIQCDEIGYGDVWTWIGIDADTKLVVSFYVGERDSFSATDFIRDLSGRLANRVQLTTDGNRTYLAAIDGTFGSEIDYAMLQKIYGNPKGNKEERRY